MSRTTICRRTWHCTGCRYESDQLVGTCSTLACVGEIYEETDPARCGSMTVIGPEDIENEVTAIQAARAARGQAELPAQAVADYKAQRMAEMNAAIAAINVRVHDAQKARAFNKAIGIMGISREPANVNLSTKIDESLV